MIMRSALEEFARGGYDAASMGRIGTAAGVTRTVLYDHFPSKRALFVELLADTHAALLSHLRDTLTAEGSMEQRMIDTFDAYLAFAEEEPQAWRVLFPDHPPIDPDVASDQQRCRTESNRIFAAMLESDAKRAGIEPASTGGQVIFAIHQAALQGAVRWWRVHPDVERAEMTKATTDALWTGLGGLARGEALTGS
jgi:AcrR family transcriptional regulator